MNPKASIKCVIIEDEEPARNLLKAYLKDFDEVELIAECENGFEGVKAINELKPDLAFLDIQMPKLTGFEMLELLDEIPDIIFTTAYDEFALKAFELNAVDYLMKPFSRDRFKTAIDRAFERVANQVDVKGKISSLSNHFVERQENLERVSVKSGNQIKIIPTEDICQIEAQDDYVMIYTMKEQFLKKSTMNYFEGKLDNETFIRIHRSFIINVNYLKSVELYSKDTYYVFLKNGSKVKVSKSKVKDLKDKLNY